MVVHVVGYVFWGRRGRGAWPVNAQFCKSPKSTDFQIRKKISSKMLERDVREPLSMS